MQEELTAEERETIATYEVTALSNPPELWDIEFESFHKLLPNGKVLEIGSGSGRDAKHLVALGYDYTGIDVARAFLKIAQKKLPRATFYQRSVYDPGFLRNSFDGFWASAVLLHVPKSRMIEALASIYGVLRPAGIGFVSLKEGDEERMEVSSQDKTRKRFFAYWQKREFEDVLGWCGFEIVEFHRKDLNGTPWLCFFVKKK